MRNQVINGELDESYRAIVGVLMIAPEQFHDNDAACKMRDVLVQAESAIRKIMAGKE